MKSNSETVEQLHKHVNTLKDAVLEPIREYSNANAGSTIPLELNRALDTLTSYVSGL